MKKTALFLTAFVAIIINACSKNNNSAYTADCSVTKTLAADVSPIIQSSSK